ncbi:hypothetical protein TWF225_004378 [Orbilia oligospora]|nr:hypothetical protein TWF225_004378 [Orbilia oligospora]KAF3260022.1 hypothetical protein TWF217_005047 [Orbilia oligospora]KAF3267103.1 hypothetical protein TWF128_010058 [Orbilia oligospora]KAF3293399.1 hypothetical protein TWF132_004719 [Orbilia oligospora]
MQINGDSSETNGSPETINDVILLERRDYENPEDKDGLYSHRTKLYELGKGPAAKRKKVEEVETEEFGNYTFRCIEQNSRYTSGRILEIKSDPVKEALEKIIIGYPDISFSVQTPTLTFPLNELHIFSDKLNALAEEEEGKGTELGHHLSVLMRFLNNEWAPFNKKVSYWTDVGLITYEYLWTLFQPGSYIYTTINKKPRVLKLDSFQYQSSCSSKWAQLYGTYIDYDGNMFGESSMDFTIPEFRGSRKILELQVFPLEKHPKKEALVKRLIDRGTKFVGLQGYHCKKYNGSVPCGSSINTRVMVDTLSYGGSKYLTALKRSAVEDETEDKYHDEDGNPIDKPETTELLELTDDEKLICTAVIPAFTLDDHKTWLEVFIDDIQDIEWNPEIFSKLVLPAETKQLIRGLVESHINEKSQFDDFIEGKGKGLISVLHGPPGLGKTMTAETVAEYTKSPLYTISAGSLGTKVSTLESNLRRILDLAQRWKAVLLLDEADVYLEERSVHDIERNALVSVFLRLVEYYQGILFLTTNRVSTFDDAFQSRIHVALRYSKLDTDAREQIWRNFITRMDKRKTSIVEEDYKELSAVDLNGRQIKNAIRTALSIADTNGETLGLKHFSIVFGVMATFERDLKGLKASRT